MGTKKSLLESLMILNSTFRSQGSSALNLLTSTILIRMRSVFLVSIFSKTYTIEKKYLRLRGKTILFSCYFLVVEKKLLSPCSADRCKRTRTVLLF